MGVLKMNIDHQVEIFNKQAGKYYKRAKQKNMDFRLRRKLLQSATGDILELSVGAGMSFQFYPKSSRITAVDFSPNMINRAKLVAADQGRQVDFRLGNVEEIALPEKTYDTVISTLSLCSYPHPEKVLKRMASWCKEDGKILLFEHGISTNTFVAWIQHKTNSFYFKKVGCHTNRDILKLVQESPLSIVKSEHYVLNTVHLIWAKPV
ncbi:class I SAM-dependent methyltransferase [Bacillus timonensis]|uniref:Class I SAM-dependent methyltransferase n=2 Tax=Bacillus timonensis TaxID=1033734 RepID=A0A4S3PMT7_9BACI|nr:class I SAM-dependent methyltransferase [Bacillus timonensis]